MDLGPRISGCRVLGFPKLVLACWWVGQILGLLAERLKVSQSWCWSTGGWDWVPGVLGLEPFCWWEGYFLT